MNFAPIHVIKQTNKYHSGCIFFFHGSGDTGQGLKEWIKILLPKNDLKFPHLQTFYPTAPLQPYTVLNGARSNVWFDRLDISPNVPDQKESIDQIGLQIKDFIKKEISTDIPLNRVIIGGFSMGGALALHLAYRFLPEVAGVFALSSFLGHNSLVYQELSKLTSDDHRKKIPLFMCHGDQDELVPIAWGESTYKNLVKLGINAEFHPVKNISHELQNEELKKLNEWIMKILPPSPNDN